MSVAVSANVLSSTAAAKAATMLVEEENQRRASKSAFGAAAAIVSGSVYFGGVVLLCKATTALPCACVSMVEEGKRARERKLWPLQKKKSK